MDNTNYFTLNNGVQIPSVGFGVWLIKDPAVCEASVTAAINAGYRLIDTAAVYLNEEAVGRAIKNGPVPRKDLFITTKLWIQNCGYEEAKIAFERSLKRLQLDYVDMYLIHWPFNDYMGSWRAMEELYEQGKIRAIGVSNFPIHVLEKLKANFKVKPVVNQVECHPIFQQRELREYLKKNDILTEAWSPLGHGNKDLFTNPVLETIAQKYSKSVQQVILRWHLQEGILAIPKSENKDRIAANYNIFDFQLSDEDMTAIRGIDTNKRLSNDPDDAEFEKGLLKHIVDI